MSPQDICRRPNPQLLGQSVGFESSGADLIGRVSSAPFLTRFLSKHGECFPQSHLTTPDWQVALASSERCWFVTVSHISVPLLVKVSRGRTFIWALPRVRPFPARPLNKIMASPKQSHLWPPTQVALTSERCTARRCYSRQRASALPTFARLCPLKEMASLSAAISKGPTAMGNRCRPVDPSRRNGREPLSLEVLYAPRRAIRDFTFASPREWLRWLKDQSLPEPIFHCEVYLYPLRRAICDRNGSPNAVANGRTWVKIKFNYLLCYQHPFGNG